jgi:hypothetical protein
MVTVGISYNKGFKYFPELYNTSKFYYLNDLMLSKTILKIYS